LGLIALGYPVFSAGTPSAETYARRFGVGIYCRRSEPSYAAVTLAANCSGAPCGAAALRSEV